MPPSTFLFVTYVIGRKSAVNFASTPTWTGAIEGQRVCLAIVVIDVIENVEPRNRGYDSRHNVAKALRIIRGGLHARRLPGRVHFELAPGTNDGSAWRHSTPIRSNPMVLTGHTNDQSPSPGGICDLCGPIATNVCLGSLADIKAWIRDVRFTPKSRLVHLRYQCPLSAISRHSTSTTPPPGLLDRAVLH